MRHRKQYNNRAISSRRSRSDANITAIKTDVDGNPPIVAPPSLPPVDAKASLALHPLDDPSEQASMSADGSWLGEAVASFAVPVADMLRVVTVLRVAVRVAVQVALAGIPDDTGLGDARVTCNCGVADVSAVDDTAIVTVCAAVAFAVAVTLAAGGVVVQVVVVVADGVPDMAALGENVMDTVFACTDD